MNETPPDTKNRNLWKRREPIPAVSQTLGASLQHTACLQQKKKKTYSKLKLGSQNGCGPRTIQICNDRFYTSEEHTLNSSHTAGLGLLLRASKMSICATTIGPVYTETSCTGQEGRPLSRVNFSKRLCKKKVDPLARVKS